MKPEKPDGHFTPTSGGVVPTATPIMDAEYYADIDLPETIARNVYRAGCRLERDRAMLREALEPFAEQDECGIGFIIGSPDHDHECSECSRVLKARDVLSKVNP